MSTYSTPSTTSTTSTQHSDYSTPPPRDYSVPSFRSMSSSRRITTAEKQQLLHSLSTHKVNTINELRRIERAFAVLGDEECAVAMTAAWSYYVNSNSLLAELRALSRDYPFSVECLEEAKRRVYTDPASNRSWNLCWLILQKIRTDNLIPYFSHLQASQPAMWASSTPGGYGHGHSLRVSEEQVGRLAQAFVREWESAVGILLRGWEGGEPVR
ncbi:unnamed protein product [Periconia digitata]|uniref:Uncharacterized protein n=1 Tax=Periconia digitata TaxID=1303443 RepID=A0A9W4U3K1_9PLEO|nr:unnamed protein product [Periconia digitata]